MAMIHKAQQLSGYWQRFTTGSANRHIFGSIVVVTCFTIAIKAISLVKELVIARTFGTGDTLEAFLVASVLPVYLLNVVGTPFGGALVPTFVKMQEQDDRQQAQQVLSSIVTLALIICGGMGLLLALVGPFILPLLGSSFDPGKFLLTQHLLLVLVPTMVLGGLIEIAAATTNVTGRFAFTSMSAGVIPLAVLVATLTLYTRVGIYVLAGGTLVGYLLQLGMLAWRLQREGWSLRPAWLHFNPAVRRVISQYWPVALGAALHNTVAMVDQAMAAMLGSGSVAALSYGNKLVSLVVSIGSTALGIAVLPYFSRMVAANDWGGVRHSLLTYTRLIVLVTAPFALVAAALSQPLITFVYQGGAFTANDTLVVSQVQSMFVLQFPFFTLCILFVQLFVALGITRLLMLGTLMNITLNVVLNALLMHVMGVAGIALSTTLMYVASSIYLFVVLQRHLKQRLLEH